METIETERTTGGHVGTVTETRGVKPGVQTTELWVSVVNALVNVALVFGVVSSEQANAITQAAVAVIGLLMAGIPLAVYVWSRAKIKAGS